MNTKSICFFLFRITFISIINGAELAEVAFLDTYYTIYIQFFYYLDILLFAEVAVSI